MWPTKPVRLSLAVALPLGILCAGLLRAAAPAAAKPDQAKPAENQFIRVERDSAEKPQALQTAIVHYVGTKPDQQGLSVDLIGAVHVGEKSYYQALNEAFEKYDVVLYELVAPAGTRVPKGGGQRTPHPLNVLQDGLKSMLNLEHQLECVDYTKDNLVHADMSPDDFSKSMDDRGESFWTMFFRMMGEGIAQQAKLESKGKSLDADLLLALFDKNRANVLKRIMAEQFESMGGVMHALDGPQGSTIVTERNKVALQGLTKQVAAGKKKIGIFYGAAHLPDMEKRLIADFGLKRSEERWLTAWNLADGQAPPPATEKVEKK